MEMSSRIASFYGRVKPKLLKQNTHSVIMIKANMLDKILENGFSPFQLVFHQNLKILSTFNDKHPTFTPSNTHKILIDNLVALHKARKAFVFSENSEKISRALCNNIRPSGNVKCITGNKIYYKRVNDRQ